MDATSNKYTYHRDATLPRTGEVFCFGSNLRGAHGAGAAKAALQYGAKMGQGVGRMGNAYAIPTKDENIQTMSIEMIRPYIAQFIEHATANPDTQYFITRIGCGLANYTDAQIAPLFVGAPLNCSFADNWRRYLN